MDNSTVCFLVAIASGFSLWIGWLYGFKLGNDKRRRTLAESKSGEEPSKIKGHDVVVELGEDSNYTKLRISIDGISTGIDHRTFVSNHLQSVISAHLISVYDRSLSITAKSKLEAIGLTKADVPQIVVEGVLYRITFVKGINETTGEYAS